jgi:acyl phosphate:glycerol-3-phosphate acyltransferase
LLESRIRDKHHQRGSQVRIKNTVQRVSGQVAAHSGLMSFMITVFVVCCTVAFLTGGIPFGYFVGRLVLKDDIRNHGSGNIGATNVGRVLGWRWGIFVLILDALKGLTPTLLTSLAAGAVLNPGTGAGTLSHLPQLETLFSPLRAAPDMASHLTIATGICAILGHMYPIYLRLRGGKGVATALGVVLVIAPWASLSSLAAFALTLAVTRTVALASIAASLTFTVVQLSTLGSEAWTSRYSTLTLFSILVPLLIVWRHRSNILKLLNRPEK